jgi:hypothetical protein
MSDVNSALDSIYLANKGNNYDQYQSAYNNYQSAIGQNFSNGASGATQDAATTSAPIAAQEAGATAAGAQQSAQQSAATAGMSPAQAALLGSNQAGSSYTSAYGTDLGNTINQYQNEQNMQLGSEQNAVSDTTNQGNADANYANAEANQTTADANQQNSNTALFGDIANMGGSLLQGVASLF